MAFQERLAILVEANAGKAIAEFRKVGAAAKQAGAGAEGGAKGLARFGIAGQAAGNLLKAGIATGVAAAGAALIKFSVDGVNAFVEVAGEIRKFQRLTGATAEDASKLVAAFHVLGIDSDTAATAVFQLTRRIESSGEKLAELGVTVARSNTGVVDVVQTLLNVGDAYKATEDPAKRANLVFQAFGRGGAPIIPILGKTREELEAIFTAAGRHGLIFNQEQVDKAKEFGVATRELGEAWKGAEVELGERLVPVLTDLAIAITKVIDATHSGIGKGFVDFLSHMPGLIQIVAVGAHLLAGNEGDVAREAAAATAAIAEQEKEFDKLKNTIFTASDAQRAFEAAGRSVESANRSLAKATADYNKLLREGAVDEQKVVDARRSLADATRSLHHAQREQNKAQEEYNEALAYFQAVGGDDAADKLADASDNLADANDNVASATDSATKASEDLKTAQAGDPEYQSKLADAKQGVADATQAVADATYNLGKRSVENIAAHDAEAAAIAGKADQVARLRGELETMLRLNPEQFAFLGPIIAALGTALAPGGAATPPPPAPVPPGPAVAGGIGALTDENFWNNVANPLGPPTPTTIPTTTTNNNVTVNVGGGAPLDPENLARKIAWELN